MFMGSAFVLCWCYLRLASTAANSPSQLLAGSLCPGNQEHLSISGSLAAGQQPMPHRLNHDAEDERIPLIAPGPSCPSFNQENQGSDGDSTIYIKNAMNP
jgi:hypothetical protein